MSDHSTANRIMKHLRLAKELAKELLDEDDLVSQISEARKAAGDVRRQYATATPASCPPVSLRGE